LLQLGCGTAGAGRPEQQVQADSTLRKRRKVKVKKGRKQDKKVYKLIC